MDREPSSVLDLVFDAVGDRHERAPDASASTVAYVPPAVYQDLTDAFGSSHLTCGPHTEPVVVYGIPVRPDPEMALVRYETETDDD